MVGILRKTEVLSNLDRLLDGGRFHDPGGSLNGPIASAVVGSRVAPVRFMPALGHHAGLFVSATDGSCSHQMAVVLAVMLLLITGCSTRLVRNVHSWAHLRLSVHRRAVTWSVKHHTGAAVTVGEFRAAGSSGVYGSWIFVDGCLRCGFCRYLFRVGAGSQSMVKFSSYAHLLSNRPRAAGSLHIKNARRHREERRSHIRG